MTVDVQFTELSQEINIDFDELSEVSDGGYDKGYNEGYDKGVEVGHEQGYIEGEKAGYVTGEQDGWGTVWDCIQAKGKRTDYQRAFMNWRTGEWKPKYDMKPTNMSYMFYSFAPSDTSLPDLLNNAGINLDLSGCDVSGQFTSYSSLTDLGTLDISKGNKSLSLFIYHAALKRLHLKLNPNGHELSGCFTGCTGLTELIIESGYVNKSISVSPCPLNKASIISVFDALMDSVTGQTVTLKKTAVNKAFETSEGANDGSNSDEWNTLVASKPNWTVSLS